MEFVNISENPTTTTPRTTFHPVCNAALRFLVPFGLKDDWGPGNVAPESNFSSVGSLMMGLGWTKGPSERGCTPLVLPRYHSKCSAHFAIHT